MLGSVTPQSILYLSGTLRSKNLKITIHSKCYKWRVVLRLQRIFIFTLSIGLLIYLYYQSVISIAVINECDGIRYKYMNMNIKLSNKNQQWQTNWQNLLLTNTSTKVTANVVGLLLPFLRCLLIHKICINKFFLHSPTACLDDSDKVSITKLLCCYAHFQSLQKPLKCTMMALLTICHYSLIVLSFYSYMQLCRSQNTYHKCL